MQRALGLWTAGTKSRVSAHPQLGHELGAVVLVPVLQRRKLKPREVPQGAQGHRAGKRGWFHIKRPAPQLPKGPPWSSFFTLTFSSLECLTFKAISKDLGAVQTWVERRVHRLPLRKVVVTLPREHRQCPGHTHGCPRGREFHRWRAPLILTGSKGQNHWLLSPRTVGSHSPQPVTQGGHKMSHRRYGAHNR